ncbi:hypothetical protein [Thorsellia kenyensis]|uniref:Uncharacterized protein n=1 Tax=Thorsellia kenyensis TaxID=1549888 RepID=A0ABV6CF63_9GAMM
MKIKRRPSIKNHGVLKNRKKRLLQQQRYRSVVYLKSSDLRFDSIDWQLVENIN